MPDEISPEPQVSRVGMKLPPFWRNNPSLWFAQIEAQFVVADIRIDSTKFYHVVAAIESDILSSVHDIILNPPEKDKYDTLKTRLIAQYAESESSKLRTLIQGLELGDQRPSSLLCKMRELAGKNFSDDLLKSLWISRLPSNIQPILAASNEELTALSAMADKIHELVLPNTINATSTSKCLAPSSLESQVAELTKQVNELTTFLHSSRPKFRDTPNRSPHLRHRSSSRKKLKEPSDGLCFYHVNFGTNARKCKPPCSFNQTGN